jgi:hypothetical protein
MRSDRPPQNSLVLLGVIHSDPLGYRRTLAFLSRHRPDAILVEISHYALRYRMEHSRRLLRRFHANLRTAARNASMDYRKALGHPRIAAIARQITLPFEYRASAAFAAASGATVAPVDRSEFSTIWIETWAELICAENLETLLKIEDAPASVASGYELAARKIRGDFPAPDLWTGGDISLWRRREDHIVSEIFSVLARSRSERPFYIGGWRHLVHSETVRTVRDAFAVDLSRCFLLDRGPVAVR